MSVLEVIKSITANRESGRLEINSSGMYGRLLFNEGKLVDARLESLSGFQAVNAVVALRGAEFSFDHVPPASHTSTITPSERVVLKRFFGIEAAEVETSSDVVAEPDWNAEPEQVIPLAEVEAISQSDVEETPTVEVARVRSHSGNGPRSFLFSWSRVGIAACLALVIALTIGAFALRSRLRATQPPASVASAETGSVAPAEPASVATVVERGSVERDANVQDLTGEWRVINTVQKTAYKSFDNMQVGFRLVINQRGRAFTAKGEKFSENGQTLAAANRTPIHVTGSIDGDKVVATFVEDGGQRRTNGRFVWKLQNDKALAGTFVSNAANSSGRSAVTKQH